MLVLTCGDDLIAGILNRSNLRTGNDNRWTRERVTSLRSHHKIPVYRPSESGQEPWLNYVMSIKYTAQSRPIVESDALIAECTAKGICAERLFGEKEILLDSVRQVVGAA